MFPVNEWVFIVNLSTYCTYWFREIAQYCTHTQRSIITSSAWNTLIPQMKPENSLHYTGIPSFRLKCVRPPCRDSFLNTSVNTGPVTLSLFWQGAAQWEFRNFSGYLHKLHIKKYKLLQTSLNRQLTCLSSGLASLLKTSQAKTNPDCFVDTSSIRLFQAQSLYKWILYLTMHTFISLTLT